MTSTRIRIWRADVLHIGALAGPLILTQFAQVALSTISVIMMGYLGPLDIAAGGLALAVFNLLRAAGFGLITPVGNLVATVAAAGLDNPDTRQKLQDLARAGFAIATLAGLACWLVMLGAGQALRWMGQDVAVVARAGEYLFSAAPGMLPLFWFQSLRNFTIGLRRPGPLLAITLMSVAVSIALNCLLTIGALGFPGLGLAGIAWSASIVHLFSFAVFLLIVRRDAMLGALLSVRAWKSSRTALTRIWTMGLPIAATYGSEAGFFSAIAFLAGTFGADALAAHTIVNQTVYIAFMISVGLSHATSICISRTWAQGDIATSRRYAYAGMSVGVFCMLLIGVADLSVPTLLLSLFLNPEIPADAAVILVAHRLIMIAALLQIFDCAQNIGVGILRGAGETHSSLLMTLIGYWGIGFPTAWLLGDLAGLGAGGTWMGLTLGLAVTTIQLVMRFRYLSGERIHDKTRNLSLNASA